jgi:predicted DCC family thiol-disulfide oxidoreductase YuxK
VLSSNPVAMEERSALFVLMDGTCPICRSAQAKVERLDSRHRVLFADYHDAAASAQAPFSAEELASEMHVRRPDGSWTKGFHGWTAILRELPGWRWLGWLMIAPPFSWCGPAVYRWIARNRYSLPGVFGRCDEEGCTIGPNASASSAPISASPVHHTGGKT